jgi:lipopolysaccharide exporter
VPESPPAIGDDAADLPVARRGETLAGRVAVGAGWLLGLRVAGRAVRLAGLAVLARVLLPEDFGLLAMAWAAAGVLETFGTLGVKLAVIRKRRADRAFYDTAWTICIARGVVLALAIAALSPLAGGFFDEPRLPAVLLGLAVARLIGGFENIAVVEFLKTLDFPRHVRFEFLTTVGAALAAVALALALGTYWALVAAEIVRALLRVGLSYLVHDYRPRLSIAALPELASFGKWVFARGVFLHLTVACPPIVVGRLLGAELLAFFNVAREIARMVATELQAPVQTALFPGVSAVAAEPRRLARAFLDNMGVAVLVFLPAAVGVAVGAPLIVRILLGENWLPAIPIVQILSIAAGLEVLRANPHLFYMASDRVRTAAMLAGVRLAVLTPATILGVQVAGIIGAAWAIVVTATVVLGIELGVAMRVFSVTLPQIAGRIWRPVVATAVMVAATLPWQRSRAGADGLAAEVLALAVLVAIGVVAYGVTIFVLWRLSGRPAGAEVRLFAIIAERLRLARLASPSRRPTPP